jgi:hypothetical protein
LIVAWCIRNCTAVRLTNQDYDPVSGVFTADLTAVNIGDVQVQGPLVVRALRFYSPFGQVQAIDADNSVGGEGAAWELGNEGLIEARAFAGARRVAFRLPPTPERQGGATLLSVQFAIFARGIGGTATR